MRESVPMLKEQLRIKTKELQNSNSDKAKHDAKIQHVLKISQDKIESLQKTVAQKDKEINSAQLSKIEDAKNSEKTNEDEQKTVFIKEQVTPGLYSELTVQHVQLATANPVKEVVIVSTVPSDTINTMWGPFTVTNVHSANLERLQSIYLNVRIVPPDSIKMNMPCQVVNSVMKVNTRLMKCPPVVPIVLRVETVVLVGGWTVIMSANSVLLVVSV